MFSYCRPDDAADEHLRLLAWEEEMLAKVEVPYRVIDVAAGDLGTSAARKFDCEAWVPSQQAYRELTSTSNCTTFQARRLGVRYRDEDGRPQVAATLNGTLATTRWLVAILENHQQPDGSVRVPTALRPTSVVATCSNRRADRRCSLPSTTAWTRPITVPDRPTGLTGSGIAFLAWRIRCVRVRRGGAGDARRRTVGGRSEGLRTASRPRVMATAVPAAWPPLSAPSTWWCTPRGRSSTAPSRAPALLVRMGRIVGIEPLGQRGRPAGSSRAWTRTRC